MREIKMRAWDKRNNKWIEQESLVLNNGLLYEDWRAFEDGEPLSEADAELVEYTGLKDKNGVEIYEGDSVRCLTSGISTVEFKAGCLGLVTDGYFFPFCDVMGECEVLGNVYEQKEEQTC